MAWQAVPNPFVAPASTGPNPATAAVLGLIPGVGAMYNGQFFKGLIHVVIFAVLISITDHYPIFGLFIAAWVFYQSFEAFHTAKARRDGLPLPDPLGLNEVGNWLNLGSRQHPGAGAWGAPPTTPGAAPGSTIPGNMPGFTPASGPASGNPGPGAYPPPYTGYQTPYQAPYPPPPGFVDPAAPPVPPPPPLPYWRRREPIGAVVLIGLGILFLLGQLDLFSSYIFRFSWPLLLIGLGVWLMISRMGSQGGSR
jgi:TM2 domain-containing membrane protein YozV